MPKNFKDLIFLKKQGLMIEEFLESLLINIIEADYLFEKIYFEFQKIILLFFY